MAIALEKMSEKEFESYSRDCIEDFADQLLKIRKLERVEALEEAAKSFQKSLPEGFGTKNTHFLKIIKRTQTIGYFRFEVKTTGAAKHAFGWNLKVFSDFRGHGLEAMRLAKTLLKELGCEKISLHVFSKNDRAVKLYQAVGFEVDGYNMSLEL